MVATTVNSPSIVARTSHTTNAATSRDGTTIGYRVVGHGPGVALVQGTMGTAQEFSELAELLATTFTVYVPDRRGRGISGPTGSDYSIQKEVEDLDAILTQTDTHNVFGLSAGGLVTLKAALSLPAIRKLAVFDPVAYLDGLPQAMMQRFESEMAAGDITGALISAMQASKMGPAFLDYFPRWLLRRLVGMMLAQQEKKGAGDYATMQDLAKSTLPNDFKVVAEMDGKLESFRAISAETLLLGGSQSPKFLRTALDALEKIVPDARRIEFAGLGHAGPWNADKMGHPEKVAPVLQQFFAQ